MPMDHRPTWRVLLPLALLVAALAPAADEPTLDELHGRALELLSQRQFDPAEQVARESLELAQTSIGSASVEAARSHDLLARALLEAGEAGLEEALHHADRAVEILSGAIGRERLDHARALRTLARVQIGRDDLGGAEASLLEGLEVQRHLPDDRTEADLLGLLAWIESTQDRPEKAAAHLERQVAALKRIDAAGGKVDDLAPALYTLANLTMRLRGHRASLPIYEEALAAAERSFPPDAPQLAWPLNGLAVAREDAGEWVEARALYDRALALTTAAWGEGHVMSRSVRHNLGVLLTKLGDYDAALEQYETKLEQDRQLESRDRNSEGQSLFAMAEILQLQGQPARAEASYRESVAQLESLERPDRPTLARAHLSLGLLLTEQGRLTEAVTELDRAEALMHESLPSGHEIFCRLQNGRGRLLARANRLEEALAAYSTALDLAQGHYGTQHPIYCTILLNRAVALARGGARAKAFRDARRADEIRIDHIRTTAEGLAERQALGYRSTVDRGLDLMLSILADPNPPSRAREAWDAVVRSRALVLDVTARRLRSAASDAETAALVEGLAAASRRYANLAVRGAASTTGGSYREELDAARSERESLELAVSRKLDATGSRMGGVTGGLEETLAGLGPREALVAFVLYRDQDLRKEGAPRRPQSRYAAWVAEPGREPRLVYLGDAEKIEALVSAWHSAVSQSPAADRDPETAERRARTRGARLRERIWDPLQLATEQLDRLYLVPDGALQLVNPYAFPLPGNGYLVERSPVVHLLTAERDLLAPAPGSSGRGALIVGNVAFDPEGAESFGSAYRGRCMGLEEFRQVRFGSLPGTGPESEAVAEVLARALAAPGEASAIRRLTGREATEATIKRLAPGRSLLHLATHGFFLGEGCVERTAAGTRGIGGLAPAPDSEPLHADLLGLAGLTCAGANARNDRGPDEEDGILTAQEIAVLDLAGVELAVLSACQTGAGVVAAGEGLLGLRRAFQVAGARRLVLSLWAVEDAATLRWMRSFYEARAAGPDGAAGAVRSAARSWLEQARAEGRSTHAFYWGGWIAIGE
jgi:CHAT domain-containing protein/tetratricopeptide (TPR) repeat protein